MIQVYLQYTAPYDTLKFVEVNSILYHTINVGESTRNTNHDMLSFISIQIRNTNFHLNVSVIFANPSLLQHVKQ